MKVLIVRVMNPEVWYAHLEGEIIDVECIPGKFTDSLVVEHPDGTYGFICPKDCEILAEVSA